MKQLHLDDSQCLNFGSTRASNKLTCAPGGEHMLLLHVNIGFHEVARGMFLFRHRHTPAPHPFLVALSPPPTRIHPPNFTKYKNRRSGGGGWGSGSAENRRKTGPRISSRTALHPSDETMFQKKIFNFFFYIMNIFNH